MPVFPLGGLYPLISTFIALCVYTLTKSQVVISVLFAHKGSGTFSFQVDNNYLYAHLIARECTFLLL